MIEKTRRKRFIERQEITVEPVVPESEAPPVQQMGTSAIFWRTRLRKEYDQEYGYTPNCDGCEALKKNDPIPRNHTEQCRKRMEETMTQNPKYKQRLDKTGERKRRRDDEDLRKEVKK